MAEAFADWFRLGTCCRQGAKSDLLTLTLNFRLNIVIKWRHPVDLLVWTISILATSQVISIWVLLTYDSDVSWQLDSSAQLGDHLYGIMIPVQTQQHYPDTELTLLYPLLIMLSVRPGTDKYQFCKSLA